LVSPINSQIKDLTTCLMGQVGKDNLNEELVELQVKNNVASRIELHSLKSAPIGVTVIYADIKDYPHWYWVPVDEKNIDLYVKFDSSPVDKVNIKVVIKGE
jgi:hypothetical protein